MLAGLQGAGKTTLAGKLALWLKSQGHQPLLVAADLQRPTPSSSCRSSASAPASRCSRPSPATASATRYACPATRSPMRKDKLYDVVIVDTAGRLGVDAEMMQQARHIRDAVQPDEVLFVLDAMIGQDALATAQAFLDGVGFDGVVLTKLDGDARGGAALSVRGVTGKPIMFASNGEKLEDFDVFHPERMASRILDMGDLLTLIEQAEKVFEADQAEEMAAKLGYGQRASPSRTSWRRCRPSRRWARSASCWGCCPGWASTRRRSTTSTTREFDRIGRSSSR